MVRVLALVALAACCAPLVAVVPAAAATGPATPYDVDGDGRPDLVVGAPFLQVGDVRAAGGVAVVLASAEGLSTRATFISQASTGAPGDAEEDDQFGDSVASGDFDRDGYADVAVGQPNETVEGLHGAGGVTVLYGSRSGLDTRRSVVITRPGGPVENTFFGGALVAADFDGDSYADLAVAASQESGAGTGAGTDGRPSGVVRILRGTSSGLSRSGGAVVRARTASGAYDVAFGGSLASGDLDGDGTADLVVGASGRRAVHDDDGRDKAVPGAVSVCRGQSSLPTSCTQVAFGTPLTGLTSLAVGNVYGSAAPEVAVGVPAGPDVDDNDDAGSVHVLQLKGVESSSRDLTIRQSSRGVPGTDTKQSEKTDEFGAAVALGDIDRDGYADLVVGAPGEDRSRGRVTVVHGARSGYRTSGNTAYDQDTKGIPSSARPGERFGQALSLDDHDGDGRIDLTIGGDDANKDVGGAVTTLRGSGRTFATQGSRTFGAAALDYPTPRESGFGEVLGG